MTKFDIKYSSLIIEVKIMIQTDFSDIDNYRAQIISGKILHLDGDRKYSEKSYNYYQKWD